MEHCLGGGRRAGTQPPANKPTLKAEFLEFISVGRTPYLLPAQHHTPDRGFVAHEMSWWHRTALGFLTANILLCAFEIRSWSS